MDSILQRFNGDGHTKDALKEYFTAYINTVALERMYKGEDVSHIKDAKELLDGVFEQLATDYGITEKATKGEDSSR
jgi:hypothetical protein